MNDDRDTDDRRAARPDADRMKPGTLYQCPQCDFGTLNFQTLREHWSQEHAEEHGQFCHADIITREGP